ncbi:hypothetical protein DPQ33_16640 [Oceanidesulfovibrio indonesiensis]|uniref:Uncharacterized protein n=1 Tax=Oceanidesulfovibrio indonesiensis TaxID=54767 RepID=A0A7M3MAM9_9BACT|nr:hypothetical protein [Oceanidesulfovibrio indonesiensis]TVM14851.1 hypothetical protein DPQ33_16640 [Oceanidesulfovibrio indonesiensis]
MMRSPAIWFVPCIVLLLATVLLISAPSVSAQTQISPYKAKEVKPGFSPPGPRSVAPPETRNVFIYYPKHNMYMDVENEKYIYRKNDRWLVASQNPVQESLGPSFTIESETDKPYLQNSAHRNQYPYKGE